MAAGSLESIRQDQSSKRRHHRREEPYRIVSRESKDASAAMEARNFEDCRGVAKGVYGSLNRSVGGTNGSDTPIARANGEKTLSAHRAVAGARMRFVTRRHKCLSQMATGTIGEYTTSGATVNASLISGLGSPNGLAISVSDLFVANGHHWRINHVRRYGERITDYGVG